MADFVRNEAEESDEEIIYRKRKCVKDDDDNDDEEEVESDDDEQEEDDDEEKLREEMKDLINDEEEEEDDDKEDSDEEIIRKRKKYHEDYDALEDEDYDLIEENLGVKIQRKKKFKRVRHIIDEESDNEEADGRGQVNDREAIANELFEGDDMECEVDASQPAADDILMDDLALSESESEDENDFIVDDDNQPISKQKKKQHVKYTDSALQQAQEIFGVDFDYADFAQEGEYDEDLDEEYEDEDVDGGNRPQQKMSRKKDTKQNLLNVFEPVELERNYLTAQDDKIRLADIPERFLLRGVPVTKADDDEINEEAEWIYTQVFSIPTISIQEDIAATGAIRQPLAGCKSRSAVGKICEALKLIRNENFEVPFIAFYRKEYVEPDLNINDLWTIYKWDEKWCQLRNRKMNLCDLFQNMQQYQCDIVTENPDKSLAEGTRALVNDDIYRLSKAQTFEEVQDCYAHFMLYYGHDISLMKEFLKAKEQKENKENEIYKENETVETKLKHILHKDTYAVCKESGIDGLAKKFGLTPEQFGENLHDNYQKHEVEQCPVEPKEVASDYVCNRFPTPEDCLSAAKYMVAIQLSREPVVRKCIRQAYFERAKLYVRPTKKGIKEIDENHACYSIKYLKNKPVKGLCGDQFLKLSLAEKSGLLMTEIVMDKQDDRHHVYLDEIKQLYKLDGFSKSVQEWNVVRQQALDLALTKFLYPEFQKELKIHLLNEAKEGIIKACRRKLNRWLKVAPFQVNEVIEEEEDFDTRNGTRVLSIAHALGKDSPAFCALIDGDGESVEYLKLPGLLFRRNSWKDKEREMKETDLNALRNLMLSKKPHVVVVSAESRHSLMVVEDVKGIIRELMDKDQFPPISVELMDNELGVLYSNSMKGKSDFKDYPPLLRQAISNARRLQDPLMEFSQLCTADEEILCLKYHPLQGEVTKDDLLNALYLEFISRTNEVGVDFNRAIQFPHTANIVQFVSGFGPRKALHYLKAVKKNNRLESRQQLVMKYKMGPKLFMNCSGFIKIDTTTLVYSTETYIDVLDGTRVHLEAYEWAHKMAIDALDYDDTSDDVDPVSALEEILENPDKLKDLDLDAFADELERQGYGNKRTTLYDIRAELNAKYKDLRTPYKRPNPEEIFNMLTKELPATLYIGKFVTASVTGFARRKPKSDQLKSDPIRHENTGLWQCAVCLKKDFANINDVWGHLDDNKCPGQAMGVQVSLDNGISGFIPTKMISDKYVANPEDRVQIGMTLHARITKIDIKRFAVDLTSRSSDLNDKDNKWRPAKDLYYDFEAEKRYRKTEEDTAKKPNKLNKPCYHNRAIWHPSFKNVPFKEAERILESMQQGDVIIRPSSKGHNHLTVTWKVTKGINQHIDVLEENKENDFSLGKSLIIGKESFEDLDEIIARHVQPMSSFARDLLNFKYYTDANGGKKEEMERFLIDMKRKGSNKIHYYVSACKDYPGKFLLSYLPRNKVVHELISVSPQGFKYRSQIFRSVNSLFRWFKEHLRDPIPGAPTATVRTPMSQLSTNSNIPNVVNIDNTAVQRVAKTLPPSLFNTLSQVAQTHGQTQAAFQGANSSAPGYSGFNYQGSYSPTQPPPFVTPSYQAVPTQSYFQVPIPQYPQTPQQNWAHPTSQMPSQATPKPTAASTSSVADLRRMAVLWANRSQENSAAYPVTTPRMPVNPGFPSPMIEGNATH